MYVIVESPVDAIRADFRRMHRGSVLRRLWHRLMLQRERAADRAAARCMRALDHPGVRADYDTAVRFGGFGARHAQ